MMKWVVIALAVFVLYKLITNDKVKKDKQETKAKERKIATGQMVKDPVCGTYVEKEGAISVRDGEATHHFCSYECRKTFLERLEQAGREIPTLETDKKDD